MATKTIRSVRFTMLLVGFMCCATQLNAQAVSIFHVRFDTVLAKPGDTAIVNVYYTFDSTKPHNLTDFAARFFYDTNEVLIDYITAETASAALFDTSGSRKGFLASSDGQTEIDLKKPVLFKMRIVVSKRLSDTAFLTWDQSWPLFEAPAYGVDSIDYVSGWVRTPPPANGHADVTLQGATQKGRYHDTVPMTIPVRISDISAANIRAMRLQFTFAPGYLEFLPATTWATNGTEGEAQIDGIWHQRALAFDEPDTVLIWLSGRNESTLTGNDTLLDLNFGMYVYSGENCTAITDVSFARLNSDAFIGNTTVTVDSVCVTQVFEDVQRGDAQERGLTIYPNPARSYFRFSKESGEGKYQVNLFDQLGRRVVCRDASTGFVELPADITSGCYRVEIEDELAQTRRDASVMVISGP